MAALLQLWSIYPGLRCCVGKPLWIWAGKWTVQQAAELSVAAPTIEASLDGRFLSAAKDERVSAAKFFEQHGVKEPEPAIKVLPCSGAWPLSCRVPAGDQANWPCHRLLG